MTSFVLVHDAWHGAWSWDEVKAHLEQAAEAEEVSCVLALDLPGHGRRAADERRNITVEDYVSAITIRVRLARLSGVVLVGHGLSASFLPLVVRQLDGVVRRTVFIAGLLPPEGGTPLEERPLLERSIARLFNAREKGFWLPTPLMEKLLGLERTGQAWRDILSRLTPDPLAPWTTPVEYGQFPGRMPTTYVLLKEDRFITHRAQTLYADLLPNADLHEMDTGHECALTHPKELADLLLRYV